MKIPKLSLAKGLPLIKLIRYALVIITISSIIFSGYNLWQEHHQLEPLLKEVGSELFNPIYNLSEHSSSLYESGFWNNTGNLFSDIWNFFINIFLLFKPLIFIYISFYYLFILSEKVIIMDESRKASSFIVTILLFFGLQFLYIVKFTDLSLLTPFTSIGNMLKLLSNYFK